MLLSLPQEVRAGEKHCASLQGLGKEMEAAQTLIGPS